MTADTVGGVWNYSLRLTRELGRRGIQVGVATMGRLLSRQQRKEASTLSNLKLYESTFKLEWMQNPWDDVDASGPWLLDLEKDFAPDVIHLNTFAHGVLPWRAPVLIVGHSCVYSWFSWVRGMAPPPEWRHYRESVMRGLMAARCVTAPSRTMLVSLHLYYGDFTSVAPIPNGIRPGEYQPMKKEPMIFSAGRLWDEAKNIGLLQQAAPDLPWPVFVAGETRGPEGGHRDMENVIPLGMLPQGEMADWMGRAAVYALPARYEPFGLSALEAGLSGCALVLGNIPSLREVWGNAALYVDPDNDRELVAAVRNLSEDETMRNTFASLARRRALTYTADRMADKYVALYNRLAVPERKFIKERLFVWGEKNR